MNKAQKEVQQAQLNDEKKVIKLLERVYEQAKKDCEQKIRELSARTDLENLQSIIYQKEYQEALKKQLSGILDDLHTRQFTSIADYLQVCYIDGFSGTMYDLHKQGIPIIIPINQDQVVKAVRTDSKLSDGLYTKLGEDIDYLKRSIRAELSRGIASGSTWNEMALRIAKGMNSPFRKAYNNAIRIARTEGHRIQNEAALDGQYGAKKKGADIVKQWDSTLDGRTRDEHRECDGQIREIDEPFDVGGEKMQAPGVGGSARNVCNCRCCLLQRAKWALDDDELKTLQERATFFGLDKTKDFEDFKQKYLKLPDNADTMKVKQKISFKSGKEANDYFYNQESYKAWEQSITDSKKKAISDYTYTDYQSINYYLRTDNDNDENILLDKRLYGNKREEQIKCIDDLLSSFELDDDITVYRNVDAEMFADYFDDTQKLVGKEITEKGYSSSSVVQSGAMTDKDCKIKIHVPSGKGRGAYINNLSEYKDNEYEFLIPRNSKFRIVKVEETEEDLLLEMEMIVDE